MSNWSAVSKSSGRRLRNGKRAQMPRLSKRLRSRCQPSRLHRVRQGARCEGATEPTVALRLGLLTRMMRWASRPEVRSAPPKVLEPIGRHVGVPDRMLDVLVPEVVLQSPCVVSVVGELEPTGVAKHVRVDRERHLGRLADALD